ncbi:MAG: CheR family methyltransferase [Alphaproteobacteria bacterium]
MTPADFDLFSGIVKERSGLALTPEKTYLLESRLMPIARRLELNDLAALAARLRKGGETDLLDEIAEAMTTNESFFFRDINPFTQFREVVLPSMLEGRAARKTIRIWCAACSTGQEPYTLAMILREEAAKLGGWRIEIVATDLSRGVLERARNGIYSQFEVQRGLPIEYLVKYFAQVDNGWQIDTSIRAMVQYKELNLLDSFAHLGVFDIVFCSNVLIYFDNETKTDVLDRIANRMPADGTLYLGGAESVIGITNTFKPVPGQRGLYALNAEAPAAAAPGIAAVAPKADGLAAASR